MLSAEDLVEVVYRAQAKGIAEDEVAMMLLAADGVSVLTLREVREHLAVALCKAPRDW